MPTWIWIVIIVAALLAIALVVGFVRYRRSRVSLAPPSSPAATGGSTAPPVKGGGYKAGGSISFSTGGTATADRPAPPSAPVEPATPQAPARGTRPFPPVTPETTDTAPPRPTEPSGAHPVTDRPETDGQPGVGDDAAVPRDSDTRSIVDVALPDAPIAPPVSKPAPEVETAPEPEVETPAPTATAPAVESPADETPVASPVVEPAPEVVLPPRRTTEFPPVRATPQGPVVGVQPEPAVEPVAPADQTAVEVDEIEPSAGRLNRLRGRLSRSQNVFGQSLLGLLGASTIDEDSWTDIEDTLLMADLGAGAAMEITDRLRKEIAAHGTTDAAGARALLRRVLVDAVGTDMDRSVRALPHDGRPSVILVVGVNGTGKTTTTGKLARVLVADGRDVVLGAADTFRAAAADQLQTWGDRAGATVVRSAAGADPAAVAFDAVKKGIETNADAVLIDTAGRLHTKTGLMDELGKVKRVVEKQAKVDEVLLVLDATTGQNGLVQATVFADVVDITGIALTKLDGTAKGGIVVAVQRALNVPVKLVGLGEGPDDLAPFEPEAFVDALLG
ncbi:signal recognition particle-docking protein FtsY [Nakamurella flava]|uniref:Signal recognition particle receptor FtsY n=1 Tax=Nakamurella flava TaxID=2576308 RepID=A0A4U6QJ98_9ACTN|nr:signal recognition particle-docking protein FtsY [Nakamurella flava]TKV60520.1 signal recognition particle-docking protein FtsY [Nakamurella flava]